MMTSETVNTLSVGVVVIGRNEGERLRRCLESVLASTERVVYVDSGSTDGSAALARSLGADVVELDDTRPHTAARGRNAGATRLAALAPDVEAIQFVDGDCEIDPGWLDAGAALLAGRERVAAVAGRLRERDRDASIYNRLCAMEWAVEPGETRSCGGVCMVRRRPLETAGGFDETIVAGEEAELCARMRGAGWTVVRLEEPMGTHDAAMTRFGQWWRRTVRAGHSFAEGCVRQGRAERRHTLRRVASIFFWGGALPLVAAAAAWPTRGASLGLLLLYGVLWWRVARHRRARGDTRADARLYATFCVLGKVAELIGAARYLVRRAMRRPGRLIEHRSGRDAGRDAEQAGGWVP